MLSSLKTSVEGWINQEIAGLGWTLPAPVVSLLEIPKDISHGQLGMPVFALAKALRMGPPQIAGQLAPKLEASKPKTVKSVKAVGGYVNIHFDDLYLQQLLFKEVSENKGQIGFSKRGKGKKLVIDFSSPNVAKPMHVGHLRATVIGQCIYNLAKTQGFEVIGLNHLGDWGVQFGKCAWGYQQWKSEYDFDNKPFESIYSIYTRFHAEAEKNPELDKLGAETFKKLENGDPEVTKIWKLFVEVSMREYQKIWTAMGVHHDLVRGESFYNDRLKPTEKLLEQKGLLVESEGAMVVPLEELNIAPCLIRKSDGASLYATRDLASALYRMEELKADVNLYVVGNDQSLHFQQVFGVLKKMGYPWAKDLHHISFGMYRFTDSKMSSRKGNAITLRELIDRAQELVAEIIEKKNPDLKDKADVAAKVGLGALIFNDLMNDRVKNVEFSWDRALDFEGNSGPYVQYSLVRCKSLIRKYGKEIKRPEIALDSPEEQDLMIHLFKFDELIAQAFDHFRPHFVAMYLIDLCQKFNFFYNKHRVISDDAAKTAARMTLVDSARAVLEAGLKALNIPIVEEM